ncbi:MAG: hypothetical protein LC102_03595 [Ignavibacteriales bacterium]|jgi:hypothetical protein|nr:MAG: hypothetical protein F9K26_07090 [Ignavibacteriaceae bacterium]MBW7872873.1 hypothetical protein [Ignavibacteria bacterium]MCZ2142498.1 hypothetical protein [Ignavibacteriales bacterium]OQY71341.1 MAG: hypothetical protein B6D45_10155 [Ignavibacteriales bacterium UTCHB3]MBV6445379.1 hypothetical protein [Ignavibacteriaceae bacterium]
MVEVIEVAEIITQYDTGNKPFLVRTKDMRVFICKMSKGEGTYLVENELIASFLLGKWGLKCPEYAIMSLKEDYNFKKNGIEYNLKIHNQFGFGSRQISGAYDYILPPSSIITNKEIDSNVDFFLDLLKIGLFDIWVENIDRRGKNFNLLVTESNKKRNIHPFDHELTFAPVIFNTEITRYQYFELYNTIEGTIFAVKSVEMSLRNPAIRAFIEKEFINYFNLSVEKCQEGFEKFITDIAEYVDLDYCKKVGSFLFDKKRNSGVLKKLGEFIR